MIMITIKGSKFPEDIFDNIDKIHEASKALYSTLPKEAFDLLSKTRNENNENNANINNKPKI